MRIMFVSDSLSIPSGLTNVCVKIMTHMKKIDPTLVMAHLSITGEKPNVQKIVKSHSAAFMQTMGESFKIYDANMTKPNGYVDFDKAISEFKPDVIFTNHDPWWCEYIAKSMFRDSFLWVYYATIEAEEYPETVNRVDTSSGAIVSLSIKDVYKNADIVIPVTSMGKRVLNNWGIATTEPIHHGIDPLEEVTQQISKEEVYGSGSSDKFIFMCLGVNSERKMLSRVLLSFSKFLSRVSDRSKYKLYLHTDIRTPQGGTDILGLSSMLGIDDNIIVQSNLLVNEGDERALVLAKYKACDAFICLPGGEGFGLGYIEAMLQGKPVIYPSHGGHVEYCSLVSPYRVDISDYTYGRNIAIRWALADTDSAANAMYTLVSDPVAAKDIGRASQEYARKQTWESKVNQMYSIVKDAPSSISKKRSSLIGTFFRRYF